MTPAPAPGAVAAPGERWWHDPPALQRYFSDVVLSEVQALRPGRPAPSPWADDADLVSALQLDSLEWLALSAALTALAPGPVTELGEPPRRAADWLRWLRQALDQAPALQGFRSSGSTGLPRQHHHPLRQLEAEVRLLAELIGPRRRVVSLVRSHHIYGFLFTLLLPRVWGGVPVCPLPPGSVVGVADLVQPGDLVVGFPEAWAALARSAIVWPADVVGVSSTAPCPDEVALAVRDQGLARLIQVYGSSETAGIGWRDDPSQGFELLACWRADEGDPQRLWRLDDALPTGSVALPDHVHWLGPRRLLPQARVDGSVSIGGVQVNPSAVARALQQQPGVAEVAVRPMGVAGGLRLKAFIVPEAGAPADLPDRLAAWAAQALAPAARPVHWQLGTALPISPVGKPADWPIPS